MTPMTRWIKPWRQIASLFRLTTPALARRSSGNRSSRDANINAGQFVTCIAEELKALDFESSKVIGLEMFMPRSELDPVTSTARSIFIPRAQSQSKGSG